MARTYGPTVFSGPYEFDYVRPVPVRPPAVLDVKASLERVEQVKAELRHPCG